MKWFFCWSQASDFRDDHDWKNLILVSVKSALANTSLIPHFLYDGEPSEFTNILEGLGVKIIYHKISFLDAILQHSQDTNYQAIARGAFLRFDIALFCDEKDEYVLYTDSDVIFCKSPDFRTYKPELIGAASQFNRSDKSDMNSGVMLINSRNFKEKHKELVEFTKNNLNLGLDQEVLRVFLGENYLSIPDIFNWKPYWGISSDAVIVHWHGPKPITIKNYLAGPSFKSHESWNELYARNPQSYAYYLSRQERFLQASAKECQQVMFTHKFSGKKIPDFWGERQKKYVLIDETFSIVSLDKRNPLQSIYGEINPEILFTFELRSGGTTQSDLIRIQCDQLSTKAFDTSQIFLKRCGEGFSLVFYDHENIDGTNYHDKGINKNFSLFDKSFQILEYEKLLKIQWFISNDWVTMGSGRKTPKSSVVAFGHELRVGKLLLDFSFDTIIEEKKFDSLKSHSRSITFLHQDWKIDQLLVYRPLVVYCLFGSQPFVEQLCISLNSLFRHGKFTGKVLIVTDRSESEIFHLLGKDIHNKLIVKRFEANDRLDFTGSRFLIADIFEVQEFQPVLYMDADVVVDSNLEPILIEVLRSGKLSAWQEINSRLPHHISVGGTLFEQDPLNLDGECGFNDGIFGVPNMSDLRSLLKSAKLVLENYAAKHGRSTLPWLDQSALNYTAKKLNMFSPEPLDKHIQLPPAADGVMNAEDRRGFVHFLVVLDQSQRAKAMADYLSKLDEKVRD